MRRRLDLLSGELGLERERMRGWGIARALAWGIDTGGVQRGHIECARLLPAAERQVACDDGGEPAISSRPRGAAASASSRCDGARFPQNDLTKGYQRSLQRLEESK